MRWPLLPILLVGIANTLVWPIFAREKLDWASVLAILVGLALIAGWFTQEMPWGTVLVMLAPIMFTGSERHGRPWEWLALSFLYPWLLAYFLLNMAPVITAYYILIKIGRYARANLMLRQ